MAAPELPGQLGERLVEHRQVVVCAVCGGVARAQQGRKCLTGGIGGAEHGVEAEAVLVVGGGPLFVLGVDIDERGVDVEHHRACPFDEPGPAPHHLAHLGEARLHFGKRLLVEVLGEGPIQRRVRAHLGKQVVLGPQVLDVGTTLPAAGEHQHLVHEHLSPVMERHALATDRDPGRKGSPESQLVSEGAERVQPHVGRHLITTGFHHHAKGAGSLHLGRALLVGVIGPSTSPVSLSRRAFPRMRAVSSQRYVNDRG